MSSRALRRLQREQDEKRQLESFQIAADRSEESEGGSEVAPILNKKLNAFDLLEEANDDTGDDVEEEVTLANEDNKLAQPSNGRSGIDSATPTSKPKKKKKKNKKRGKEKADNVGAGAQPGQSSTDPEMDEIDRALKELSSKDPRHTHSQNESVKAGAAASWTISTSKMLSVDSKNLNPLTEMKSLFGSVALEAPAPRPRARGEEQHVDLGTALMGRYSPASKGQEMGSMASRRNILMQAKAEWPRATSGGLGMELKGEHDPAGKLYQIVHTSAYVTTQQQFQVAVEMMQPERMISLLQFNPYHISTLLQVSEISRHQGDHAVSADLLERALFTFGRSVHSTFSVSLRDGLARLDFNVPENRELWLAIWKYISNLGMRGTWRTAFEWAKLLLSLDPLKDPYAVTLSIDQLALRGRQQEQFAKLCEPSAFGATWAHLPNIWISLPLAYHRLKEPRKARQYLAEAIHKYPYIIHRLFQELDLSPIPKSVWGSLPSTDAENLFTELYATRARDLWNTPETTALLMEVTQSFASYDTSNVTLGPKLEISLEEARHVLLTETPALIALLPRRFTQMHTSGADPLPPPSSTSSDGFTSRAPGATNPTFALPTEAIRNAANTGAGWFSRLMEWFQGPGQLLEGDELGEAFQEALAAEGNEIPPRIRAAFQTQGDVPNESGDDGDEEGGVPALIDENGQTASEEEAVLAEELQRNAHAATVEDDISEDERIGRPVISPANDRAILRSRSRTPNNVAAILSAAGIAPEESALSGSGPPHIGLTASSLNDPQRVQRWLLSTGLEPFQSSLKKYGADLGDWPTFDFPRDDVNKYFTALMSLRSQQRDWVLNVLGQRDKVTADMVRGVMRTGDIIEL